MKKTNTKANKSNQKTPRLSKPGQEEKHIQNAAEEKDRMEKVVQETERVLKALKALQTADRKSAEHTYLAGKSLSNIKEDKLYRIQGFKSFRVFVGKKFKISEQYAYMLINAAETQDILTEAGVASNYASEKQLRKLTFLRILGFSLR